jgi:CRISPR-associated protein Csb3
MGHTTVPVDLFNPGQVFACLGLCEIASVLADGAPVSGGFDWSAPAARFHVRWPLDGNPVGAVLGFLKDAAVTSLSPADDENKPMLDTTKWDVTTVGVRSGGPFPFPEPDSPATLPALLTLGGHRFLLDHWGDATHRDNVKFWAGAAGYPGVGLLRDALALARPHLAAAVADPFAVSAPQSSSFRFDWRRDYVPLGVGFSLNNHSRLSPLGYPAVEILAAAGLSHARPLRPERRNKLLYRYAVLGGDDLPLPLLRAALGCASLPFPTRTFRIALDWPGQEGQARCITDTIEETP